MNISIDYDYTYTLDPVTWNKCITTLQAAGHTVYCVSARHHWNSKEIVDALGKLCKVYCTDKQAKKSFMLNLGIQIDVWIDDTPWAILESRDEHRTN